MKQFIIAYNSQIGVEEQIGLDNIQLVVARLMDKDNDGEVTPSEIADFFLDIWDDEKSRLRINNISKKHQEDCADCRSYLLIQ